MGSAAKALQGVGTLIMKLNKSSLLAGTFSLFVAAPVAAQQADEGAQSDVFDVIIVTAQKRDENLQDIPLAITAVTDDFLNANNITDFTSLSNFAPGLTVSPAEGGDRVTVSIRGVGQEANQNDVAAPSVSFHQDGVYIVSPFALGAAFLDVGTVEVVRGPQGTLFGQNSTGGAININSKQPRLGVAEGYIDAAVGSFDHRSIEAAINVPIGDVLAIRGSINYTNQDGSTINIFNGQDLDDKNQTAWRVKALFEPTDTLSIVATAQQYSSDTNGAARFGLLDPTPGERRLSQDDPSSTELDTELYSLVVSLELEPFTAKYLGSYQVAEIVRSRDNDFTSGNLVTPLQLRRSFEERQDQLHKSWTSELNLVSNAPLFGAVDWVVGAFWFDQDIEAVTFERVDQNRNGVLDPFTLAPNPVVFGIPPFGADVGFQSNFFPSRSSYSFYGQGTWSVNDALRLTGGLRYTYDEASNLNFNFFTIANNTPTADITNVSEAVTGRLAAEYDLDVDKIVYVSFTRGFKPGGNNLTFGRADIADDLVFASFESETINAYEAGFKGDFADGRLRTNIAAFYYDYTNLQAQGTDPRNVASGVVNVPKSEVLGLESEVLFAPVDTITFSANLTLLDSKISAPFIALDNIDAAAAEFPLVVTNGVNQFADSVTLARAAAATDLEGNNLAKTPPLAASFTAQYQNDITSNAEATVAFTVSYRDDMNARIFNNPAVDNIPSHTLVNASAGLALDNGVSFNLIVQNLFDTDAAASRFTDVFGVFSTFDLKLPPRTIIGSLRYEF